MRKNGKKYYENEYNLILVALKRYLFLSRKKIAYVTGISQEQLKKYLAEMIDDKRIIAERHGAHFYYKAHASAIALLDSTFVDGVIDTLKVLPIEESAERKARTCYNHFAGLLGVSLLENFLQAGLIVADNDNSYRLTHKGKTIFAEFGIDREPIKVCLDRTERKYHLSGRFGEKLAQQFFKLKWIVRVKHKRFVYITPAGEEHLQKKFQLDLRDDFLRK